MKPTRDDPTAVGTSEVADAIIEKLEVLAVRRKITVVGAGNVGATCAQELARRDYADVVLVDIKEGLPQGKALDIDRRRCPQVRGQRDRLERVRGDCGLRRGRDHGRPPSLSRHEPRRPRHHERRHRPLRDRAGARPFAGRDLVVVSNPLDAMCHVKDASSFPKERVVGMAGILDTARFSTFIAWETGASVKDVTAMVLGGHGDQMVPVVSHTTVGGVPLERLVPRDRIDAMVERTRKGGEIVQLLGTSAWYAPGAAAAQMVDSICLDEKRVLPCTAYLEGEYGIDGLYMGVPAKLGAAGVEEFSSSSSPTRSRAGSESPPRPCARSSAS